MLILLLKISVAVLVVAIGMGSTWRDVAYLWRQPALLVRSLLAMYVAVPLGALVLVELLPLTASARASLLVLAVSAGAPLLPRKLRDVAGDAYAFSLVVSSAVLA